MIYNKRKKKHIIMDISKDIEKYIRAEKIANNLYKASTPKSEMEMLDNEYINFMSDSVNREKLLEHLNKSDKKHRLLSRIKQADKNSHTNNLIELLKKRKSSKRRLIIKYISVAAAIFVVSLLVYNADLKKQEELRPEQTNLVSDVPVVVLDEGDVVQLNSSSVSQEITKKTNISKIKENKITYKQGDKNTKKIKYNTIIVPSKYTYSVTLADGTTVKLNANSRLRYPINFVGDSREVELKGEAYFDVTKSNKPFIVKLENEKIKVYGTEFNIKTNRIGYIETLLVSGSIGFIAADNKETVLKPNELLTHHRMNNISKVKSVNAKQYLGWIENSFLFELQPLELFLDDVANWYGVSFSYNNELLKDISVSVNIDRSYTLYELTKYVEDMFDIKFINEGRGNYLIMKGGE